MKRKTFLLGLVFMSVLFFAISAFGESISFHTGIGDASFDADLGNINVEARADLPAFIADLSIFSGVPKVKIENFLYVEKMVPADVYMICGLTKVVNRPVDTVFVEYHTHKHKGWGVISKNLGIKPGSKKFHELKAGGHAYLIKIEKGKEKKKSKGEGKHKDKHK